MVLEGDVEVEEVYGEREEREGGGLKERMGELGQ